VDVLEIMLELAYLGKYCTKKGIGEGRFMELVTATQLWCVAGVTLLHKLYQFSVPQTLLWDPKFHFICNKKFKGNIDLLHEFVLEAAVFMTRSAIDF